VTSRTDGATARKGQKTENSQLTNIISPLKRDRKEWENMEKES